MKDGAFAGLLRSRLFPIVATVAVLVTGFLLAPRLGIGGIVLPGVALVAFTMIGRSLTRDSDGSRGGQGSVGIHGGRSSARRPAVHSR